jgi:hypothetical protein
MKKIITLILCKEPEPLNLTEEQINGKFINYYLLLLIKIK